MTDYFDNHSMCACVCMGGGGEGAGGMCQPMGVRGGGGVTMATIFPKHRMKNRVKNC